MELETPASIPVEQPSINTTDPEESVEVENVEANELVDGVEPVEGDGTEVIPSEQKEEYLELKLLLDTKSKELNDLRRSRADRLLIKSLDEELLALKQDYFEKAGIKFAIAADEIAYEFVYNYYDVLDHERNTSSLMPYYRSRSSFLVDGYSKFFGQANIIKAITVSNFYHNQNDDRLHSRSNILGKVF